MAQYHSSEVHFAEVHCVMHRHKGVGRQSKGRVLGYVHDKEMIPKPFLVIKKTTNTVRQYQAEKEAYAKIHSIGEEESFMKQHFAQPLGYNDEEQSIFLSYESPINYKSASLALKLLFKDCFCHQFKTVVHFMDRYEISWEYNEQNILISHLEYKERDGLVQGPLLIFIDFASGQALKTKGAQSFINSFENSFK